MFFCLFRHTKRLFQTLIGILMYFMLFQAGHVRIQGDFESEEAEGCCVWLTGLWYVMSFILKLDVQSGVDVILTCYVLHYL